MARGNHQARPRKVQRNLFETLAIDEESPPPAPAPAPAPALAPAPTLALTRFVPRTTLSIAAYFPKITVNACPPTQGQTLSYAQAAVGDKRNNNEVETPSVSPSPLKKANTNVSQPDLDGDTTMGGDERSNATPAENENELEGTAVVDERDSNVATERFTAQDKGKAVARAPAHHTTGRFEATPSNDRHALDSYAISVSPPNTPANHNDEEAYTPCPSPLPNGPQYSHSRPPTPYIQHHYPRSMWPPDIEGSTFNSNLPSGDPENGNETPPPHAHCTLSTGCGNPGFQQLPYRTPTRAPSLPNHAAAPNHGAARPATLNTYVPGSPRARNAFIDDEDDPEDEEDEPQTGNNAIEPPILYYDGPIPDHSLSFIHIMESAEKGTEEKWRKIPGHKLLAFFAKERPSDLWLAHIEEIKREIKRVTGTSAEVKVAYTKVNGEASKLFLYDMIQPYLVHGLTRTQMEAMASKSMTSCSRSWIIWNLFDMPNPKYALTLPRIPIRDTPENRPLIVKGVCETLRGSKVYGPLLDHVAEYSNRYPEDFPKDPQRRVRALLRSITVSAITVKNRGNEEMMWRVCLEPPHDDPAVHHGFIESLKRFNYTIDEQVYKPWEDYKCISCRGRDHPQGLCPFRALPGFHDTRFGEGIEQVNATIPVAIPAPSSLLDIGKQNLKERGPSIAPSNRNFRGMTNTPSANNQSTFGGNQVASSSRLNNNGGRGRTQGVRGRGNG